MKTVLWIVFRHLGYKHQGTFTSFASITTMIGLGLGVCALIITASVLNGFEDTISTKIAGLDGHLRVQHFLFKPVDPFQEKLDSLFISKSIKYSLHAYVQEASMVRKGRQAEGVLIEGYGKDGLPQSIAGMVRKGSAKLGQGHAVIGHELARTLKVDVGDNMIFVDMKSMLSMLSDRRMKQMVVGGIYKSGLQEYDQTVVYMSIQDAQALFDYDNKVSGYRITFEEKAYPQLIAENIEATLGYPFYAITWKEKHQTLFNWLNLQKWPILVIFGMIALVGVVNIVSALTMIVLEKLRTIGTLMTMGMSKKSIHNIFMIKGLFIGLLGFIMGLVLALILASIQINFKILSISEEIYFMNHVPILLDWRFISLLGLCILIVTILTALWPAHRAVRVEPAVALRYV